MKLNLHNFIPETRAEGPGKRACIQVQGCKIKCPGCGVPQTWNTKIGNWVEADYLIDLIENGPDIEGVTFLGGEPFLQASALSYIGRELKKLDLGVITFSGYYLDYIKSAKRSDFNALLEVTDLLIDGPFEHKNLDFSRPWVGSSNQKYNHLTERYAELLGGQNMPSNKLEVRLRPDGSIQANGLVPVEFIKKILDLGSSSN